jgi:hAT family C-terminal dimerisation region
MLGKDNFPTLFQHAFGTLSCPAMSTECERVFSSTKELITPERNSLIEQQFGHFKKQKQSAAARLLASTAGSTAGSTGFKSEAEICTLRSQTYSFSNSITLLVVPS